MAGHRPRVGLICGHFDPTHDGVADYTRQLSRHLQSAGLAPLICTTHRHAACSAGVIGVTKTWTYRGVRRAARALAELDLDVVHVQFAPSAFGFSRAVGLLPWLLPRGVPIAVTLHEYGVWRGRGRVRSHAWSALERRGLADRETLLLATGADRLLICSPEHHDVLTSRFAGRVEATLVPIGPNIAVHPIDTQSARAAVRSRYGMPPDAALAVFFGFLHPVKGLERLVEAVASVRREHPELRLVLAGGIESHSVRGQAAAALRGALEATARSCGVAEHVMFTGYLPEAEVSQLLLAADAAVFPFNDGVTDKSGSLLTALAHGVPTIATSPPGVATGISETRGILAIPRRDTAALADALRRLLTDPDLAQRLRAAGRAHAAGHSWQAIAATHIEVYDSMLRPASRGVST